MPEISFIYKLSDNLSKTYFGKICLPHLSDDHDGLDNEIKETVITCINLYRKSRGFGLVQDVILGILGTTTEWSSFGERKMFDMYIIKEITQNLYFMNGQEIMNEQEI